MRGIFVLFVLVLLSCFLFWVLFCGSRAVPPRRRFLCPVYRVAFVVIESTRSGLHRQDNTILLSRAESIPASLREGGVGARVGGLTSWSTQIHGPKLEIFAKLLLLCEGMIFGCPAGRKARLRFVYRR